jgi:predicted HTH transcriptional regulator
VEADALNKKLEEVIIKTAAAFANRQGGILLIGACDDGSVVGWKSDY